MAMIIIIITLKIHATMEIKTSSSINLQIQEYSF